MESGKDATRPPMSRSEAMGMLAELIRISKTKGTVGRVKNPENERVRNSWIRAAIYGATAYLNGLKDMELDAITKRLDTLEAGKA